MLDAFRTKAGVDRFRNRKFATAATTLAAVEKTYYLWQCIAIEFIEHPLKNSYTICARCNARFSAVAEALIVENGTNKAVVVLVVRTGQHLNEVRRFRLRLRNLKGETISGGCVLNGEGRITSKHKLERGFVVHVVHYIEL